MATITLKGKEIHTEGDLPKVGSKAPDFTLTDADLKDVGLVQWNGKKKLLNIFPSIDTPICAKSTRRFNEHAKANPDVAMLMISADLPFAQKRFCDEEGLENVVSLSAMRNDEFGDDYGVTINDGPMAGLMARAVLVLDEHNTVVHAQLVPEIGDEPDYDAAVRALGG